MTDALSAHPPVLASLPPARGSYGPAPGDDPEVENYDADFSELWQNPKEGMTFGDLLDIINPLQHIPIVSTVYRVVTGDQIGVGSRLAGGALFGGLPGLIASALVSAYETVEGRSVDVQIASLLGGDDPAGGPAEQQVAQAAPAQAAAAQAGKPDGKRPDPPAPVSPPIPAPATALFTARHRAARADIPGGNDTAAAPAAPAKPADSTHEARDDRAAAGRQRIADALARSRAQEAALLLASLSPTPTETRKRAAEEAPPAAPKSEAPAAARKTEAPATVRTTVPGPAVTAETARPKDPFQAHPFALAPGASPELISRAMEQALNKYQQGLRARSAAR